MTLNWLQCSLRPLSRGLSMTASSRDMWPTGFKHPIKHKREFPEARESGLFEETSLNPVRSAPSEANCSVFRQSPDKLTKFIRLTMMEKDRMRAEWELREAFRLIKKAQLAKYWKTKEESRRKAITINPEELFLKALE